jgi:hypothetical protein
MLFAALCALLALAGPAEAKKAHHKAAPPPEQNSPLPNVTGCDDIDTSACMLPFPNDLYTKPDSTSATGRRIDFNLLAMPRNIAGKPIDPTDQNRADGFSPGSEIVTKITGLDTDQQLDATGAARLWNPEASLATTAPVAVIDADTGAKQMVWAELDHSMDALNGTPADRDLIIRPSKNFLEGHRYIVALRLGKGVQTDPTFAAYRDNTPLSNPFDEQRRAHFEALFDTLKGAGIKRADLTQAWDFTVASGQNIAGRMLAIRNDAFHQLGDDNLSDLKVEGKAPTFTLTRVTNIGCSQGIDPGDPPIGDTSCPGGQDGPIAYDVKGTMDVPCYLSTPACAPAHSHFILDPTTNLPVQIPGNVMKVDFRCRIPQVALDNPGTARPSLYGHGLFGSYDEIGQGQLKNMMAEHDFVYCATNWAGMAEEDIPNVATILTDASHFNTLADRVQQGMLNFLYLGRLMIHPDGLCSQPQFQSKGQCIINTRRLYYDGNSQGGIIGGALTAVAPDFTRATLGVLGMNYSTLLTRSTDFGQGNPPTSGDIEYAWPLYQAYPQHNERQLIFSIMQMLWDRAEPDGYAQHMTTENYADTPQHQVMLMAAYGDHQVSNVAAETEARTVGAKVLKKDMLRPWRPWEHDPWVGLQAIDSFPARNASVFTIWDGGSRPVPLSNIAQDNAKDDDPHEWVRNTFQARAMKSAFLDFDSTVVDTCTHTDPATGQTVPYCDTDSKGADLDKSPTYQPK